MGTRAKLLLGVLTFAVALSSSACGSHDNGPQVATANGVRPSAPGPTASAAPTDRIDQLRVFAQCMRDHGINIADPDPQAAFGGVAGMANGVDANDPAVRAAFAACQPNLPNAGQPPKLSPQQVDLYRAFAQCMRDNGYPDIPDPAPDGTLQFSGNIAQALRDPTFTKALEACRDKLTALLPGAAAAIPSAASS